MSRNELGHGIKKGKCMLTCKQASKLISQSLDRPLSFSSRMKLRLHLFICDACSRFKQQLNQLRIAVKRAALQTEDDSSIQLSKEAKARINSSIESNNH